jgi:hypothetical protein
MPIEIRLVQTPIDIVIVAFDGRVLEIFRTLWEGKTQRFHAAMIAEIQVQTDKKGAHRLYLKAQAGYSETLIVDDGALPVVQELVAQVQQAMEKYR